MTKKPVNIGIIGAGAWGNHLLENIIKIDGFALKYICCRKSEDVKVKTDASIVFGHNIMLEDDRIDGVIIATQPEKHFETASKFLKKGLKIFIEKPLALSYKECALLLKTAKRNPSSGIMVGNKFIYSSAINSLKGFISKNNIEIRTISSRWLKSGPVQKSGIFFDICYHHINLFDYLLGRQFDDLRFFVLNKQDGVPTSGTVMLEYKSKICSIEASYNNHFDFYDHNMRIETNKGTFMIKEKERKVSVSLDNKGISPLTFEYEEKKETCVERELLAYYKWLAEGKRVRFTTEHDLKIIKFLTKSGLASEKHIS